MSDQTRQPSAVTLSAQNLAFSPQGFVRGGGQQVGNVPVQFPAPMVGQQGVPMTADMMRQAQKMREYEQQRSKLQQLSARGNPAVNPDAMIAQMLGKPLAPNTPVSASASANRRQAPPGSSFMFVNQGHYPTSAPPYVGAIPPTAAHVPGHTAPSNRPMAPFLLPETGSTVPSSALHLTPKDLEKMMHHFAGIRLENGKFPSAMGGEFAHAGFKSSDGVFVIPTMPPPMPALDARMASPVYFMPPWTRDKNKLPDEYLKCLNACLAPNRPYGGDLPDTSLVYVLLRTSGLSNEILGTIWAMVNRSQPGQLVKEEFFAALALVAVAQETGTVSSLESLGSLARPPIPRLSLSALNVPSSPAAYTQPPPSSVDRRPSNGVVEPAPNPVQSTVSSDDFGEFTDFQAAPTVVKREENQNHGGDPYAALRALGDNGPESATKSSSMEISGPDSLIRSTGKPDPTSSAIMKPHPSVFVKPARKSTSRDDSFGDFTGAEAQKCEESISNLDSSIPIVRSRTEPKIASGFMVDMAQKKDLNELLKQTFESLDLGGGGGSIVKSDDDGSIKSGSKEPSVHSLDLQSLKHFDVEQLESGEPDSNHAQIISATMRSPAGSISLVDRYAAFRENGETNGESANEKHVDVWTKCLEACLQLLKQAEHVFSKADDENMRKEILSTDRGSKYLCGNVQIYRVSRRIRLSLQTMAFQTDKLIDLLTDMEGAWSGLCSYVAFSGLLPTPENLDFRTSLLPTSDERRKISCCGICLLNVDTTCKTDQGTSFDYKLTYGGRQYHAQCANLWINCVDSVLPALDVPCLL